MTVEQVIRLDHRIGYVVKEARRRRAAGVPLNDAWYGGRRCASGLKQFLARLVGPGRIEGPPELQTVEVENLVSEHVLTILERPAYLRPCPKCGGPTWDNRKKKHLGVFKANAPDFSCRKGDCDGAIWRRSRS